MPSAEPSHANACDAPSCTETIGALSEKIGRIDPGNEGVVAVRTPCHKVRCQLPYNLPGEVISTT